MPPVDTAAVTRDHLSRPLPPRGRARVTGGAGLEAAGPRASGGTS